MKAARARTTDQPEALKSRVFIVDDHAVVQHGFTQRINIESDLEVCGSATNTQDAMELISRLEPDVALVDLALGRGDGMDLIKNLKCRGDEVRLLVVSGHDEDVYAERCIRAGAQGYLHKGEAIDQVVNAIRAVLAGQFYLSDGAAKRTLHRALSAPGSVSTESSLEVLSDRELQVYKLLGQGLTIKEIGERLFLSPKTIETYRSHLKRKLNLSTSSELTRHSIQWAMEQD